jgi:P-type E1-E2 ATPase
MGTGSDVTKEASDIVLTDDDISTVVDAIREGRRIFANIRKFVIHLLSANTAQLFALLIPVLIGYRVPLVKFS